MNRKSNEQDCFVIMPISDPEGYIAGHFRNVFEDIIKPACDNSGFNAVLASDVKETNLIQLDILQKLLNAPMALCDLSSRNPNVLFELALRQAFDKPVVLIQEIGTPQIFDISPLRYTEYRKELIYREVIQDQKKISDAIRKTYDASGKNSGINSIVKLLKLSKPAELPEIDSGTETANYQQLILSELSSIKRQIRMIDSPTRASEYEIVSSVDRNFSSEKAHLNDRMKRLVMQINNLEEEINSEDLSSYPVLRFKVEILNRDLMEISDDSPSYMDELINKYKMRLDILGDKIREFRENRK
jgi:hypothetical protein